jgi:hypothetical protein
VATVLVFAAHMVVGCAHTEARCAHRSPSPALATASATAEERDWYQRREKVLQLVRKMYDDGMQSFSAVAPQGPETARGGPQFFPSTTS